MSKSCSHQNDKDCVASNTYAGLTGAAGVSTIAENAWEYCAQVATNLTVDDNILDDFVSKIMANLVFGVDAVVNVSQWDALGVGQQRSRVTTDPRIRTYHQNHCSIPDTVVLQEMSGGQVMGDG